MKWLSVYEECCEAVSGLIWFLWPGLEAGSTPYVRQAEKYFLLGG